MTFIQPLFPSLKLVYYRGPNMGARRDDHALIQLPPVEGTADLPEGVFPETLKDLKTLDGMFHLLFTS